MLPNGGIHRVEVEPGLTPQEFATFEIQATQQTPMTAFLFPGL
jgi:hypothetical protein